MSPSPRAQSTVSVKYDLRSRMVATIYWVKLRGTICLIYSLTTPASFLAVRHMLIDESKHKVPLRILTSVRVGFPLGNLDTHIVRILR